MCLASYQCFDSDPEHRLCLTRGPHPREPHCICLCTSRRVRPSPWEARHGCGKLARCLRLTTLSCTLSKIPTRPKLAPYCLPTCGRLRFCILASWSARLESCGRTFAERAHEHRHGSFTRLIQVNASKYNNYPLYNNWSCWCFHFVVVVVACGDGFLCSHGCCCRRHGVACSENTHQSCISRDAAGFLQVRHASAGSGAMAMPSLASICRNHLRSLLPATMLTAMPRRP